MTVFFSADEHYGHKNIIKYCKRPFDNVKEMDRTLINNHNAIVGPNDLTYHIGDFSFYSKEKTQTQIINNLNGKHVFLNGSHDKWLRGSKASQILEIWIEGIVLVLCHYPLSIWSKSHYNSYHLFGHCHGEFTTFGKSYDVGVDSNGFAPVSFVNVLKIMHNKPNNVNYISTKRKVLNIQLK